jgi:COP9 signalosome complex subunit 7
MSSDKQASNPTEQFVLLAKSTKGMAAVELVKQVLEAPGVFVFGELLDMPNIQEVNHS